MTTIYRLTFVICRLPLA